jgi:hypothetical protein
MIERIKSVDETITCSSLKLLFVFLLKLEIVTSTTNRNTNTSNHSCYTCIEPLVGYSKSCKSNITDS